MTEQPSPDELREKAYEHQKKDLSWPQYYQSGHHIASMDTDEGSDYVPAYYRIDGPRGPVWYVNPGSEAPRPTTMYDLFMESQSNDFGWIPREDTPWPEIEEKHDEI